MRTLPLLPHFLRLYSLFRQADSHWCRRTAIQHGVVVHTRGCFYGSWVISPPCITPNTLAACHTFHRSPQFGTKSFMARWPASMEYCCRNISTSGCQMFSGIAVASQECQKYLFGWINKFLAGNAVWPSTTESLSSHTFRESLKNQLVFEEFGGAALQACIQLWC